jgi:hypothetical protein
MKKKRRHNGFLVILYLAFAARSVSAQAPPSFHWRADLDTIRQTAFYKIPLSPELVAKCQPDLADLRIGGPNSLFVPYVLRDADPQDSAGSVWQTIPDPVLRQKDSSNRHSYITLQYRESYQIDKLSLDIRAPALYKRIARIYTMDIGGTPVAIFSIDPGHTSFRIPAVKSSRLIIDIANADNAPLVISRIATAQLGRYMLTYLQTGVTYHILVGNALANPPEYDLKYFVDSLTGTPREILPGPLKTVTATGVVKTRQVATTPATTAGNDRSGTLLWSVIILVLLLLIYLSVKMVKAIHEKE